MDPSSDQDLWWSALAAASVVVVIIALLLGLVINVLRQIDRHAARTHTAAKQIAQNTVALWTLEQTNRDLVAIRDAARGAERASATGSEGALTAVTHKVQDWLGGTEPTDDGSS